MAYAKKTCNLCGWRDIVPKMMKRPKTVQVAQGKRGLSKREVFFAVAGSKSARNSVKKWATAPNKRVYSSTRTVWMCEDCAGEKSEYTLQQEAAERRRKYEEAKAAFLIEKKKIEAQNDTLNEKIRGLQTKRQSVVSQMNKLRLPIINQYYKEAEPGIEKSALDVEAYVEEKNFFYYANTSLNDKSVEGKYKKRIEKNLERLGSKPTIIKQLRYAMKPSLNPRQAKDFGKPDFAGSNYSLRQPGMIYQSAQSSLGVRVLRFFMWSMIVVLGFWTLSDLFSALFLNILIYAVFIAGLFYLLTICHSKNVKEQIETRKRYRSVYDFVKKQGVDLYNMYKPHLALPEDEKGQELTSKLKALEDEYKYLDDKIEQMRNEIAANEKYLTSEGKKFSASY
ncbi:MAG: hypothetical protein ACON41_07220 [Parvibaculales bacterium]